MNELRAQIDTMKKKEKSLQLVRLVPSQVKPKEEKISKNEKKKLLEQIEVLKSEKKMIKDGVMKTLELKVTHLKKRLKDFTNCRSCGDEISEAGIN